MSEAGLDDDTVEDTPDKEGEEEFQPIRTTTLRNMLRAQPGPQVSEKSRDEMVDKLTTLTIKIWEKAVQIAERNDRGTVEPRDVEMAYQQILKPHNLLHQAVTDVDKLRDRLEEHAHESPFSTNLTDK